MRSRGTRRHVLKPEACATRRRRNHRQLSVGKHLNGQVRRQLTDAAALDQPQHLRLPIAALRYCRKLGVPIQAVMTDNGSAHKPMRFAKLLRQLGIKHRRTQPYTPRTIGEAERFIQTLLRDWTYAYR